MRREPTRLMWYRLPKRALSLASAVTCASVGRHDLPLDIAVVPRGTDVVVGFLRASISW